MNSKDFNDGKSDNIHVNRKRILSGHCELPPSKKACLVDSMDKLANFSIATDSADKENCRKKPADKKILAIRLVPGKK